MLFTLYSIKVNLFDIQLTFSLLSQPKVHEKAPV